MSYREVTGKYESNSFNRWNNDVTSNRFHRENVLVGLPAADFS